MIHETIYKRLMRLLKDVEVDELNPGDYGVSKKDENSGFMSLHLDVLNKKEDHVTIALAHNYQENGDTIPDPDMEINVYFKTGLAEALAYQDRYSYQVVYPEPGKVNVSLKNSLNRFLAQWLLNCIHQGHEVLLVKETK